MKLLEEFKLTEKQLSSLKQYISLLLTWNEKFNLTAITDEEQIIEKHFADSLYLSKFISLKGKTLLDVGTGAGFPGVPLAILEPNLNVTLLESNGKKISFLNAVVSELGLNNVKVVQGRSEELELRETFDIVTARAVKELNVLLEICFHLVKVGGSFIAYKSVNVDNELANAKHALKSLSISDYKKYEYYLPKSKDQRYLIEIVKTVKTIKKYPRNYSEITKHPL